MYELVAFQYEIGIAACHLGRYLDRHIQTDIPMYIYQYSSCQMSEMLDTEKSVKWAESS